MTTVRQIDGMWTDGQGRKLFSELSKFRPDVPEFLAGDLGILPIAAAALSMIRLQELNQTRTQLYRALLARVLVTQDADGGWGDTLATVLAARALLNDPEGRSAGLKAVILLSNFQLDDGTFPRTLARRLAGDTLATAFVLAHLARMSEVANRVRVEAAIGALVEARPTASPLLQPLIKLAISRASSQIGGQARGIVQLALAS
jgi:hypothetical protein